VTPPSDRGARRRARWAIAAVLVLVVVASVGAWWAARGRGTGGPSGRGQALAVAGAFLSRYEQPGGRVVRWDQGGDTVSEGQAYAMLLAVATGARGRFVAAWHWAVTHLEERSGLFAWRWKAGRVVGRQPAADADVDIAWALTLGAGRFHDARLRADAHRVASAVLANEVVTVEGLPTLTAGPWADGPPATIDPSYVAPLDVAALARSAAASGTGSQAAAWRGVAESGRRELAALLAGGRLPSNWATVTTQGAGRPAAVVPAPTPRDPGAAPTYGFDAVRVPVRLAAACDHADRSLAARIWPLLAHRTSSREALVDLGLAGSPSTGASRSPVGLVGAAAAAGAAGHVGAADRLLDRAQRGNHRTPTYYGTAWVALGRVLLQTHLLGGCSAVAG
jgi:endo-1,4-beta-D-glucanase Y